MIKNHGKVHASHGGLGNLNFGFRIIILLGLFRRLAFRLV